MTPHSPGDIRRGLWLGLLGIVIFAVTLPMTRLAVGTPGAPGGGGAINLADLLLLGERLDAVTVGFGLAVIATVFIGKKMPANAGAAHQQPSKV